MRLSTTALHHVVDMPISFPEPVILSLRWTRVNKGSREKIDCNIHGAIFTPESTETKMASLQTQKYNSRFVCGMKDQVNTFDANCFLYHERECVKFLIFELREKVTRETVHCCCVQMYTATLEDFLGVNASYPVLECRKRTGLSW